MTHGADRGSGRSTELLTGTIIVTLIILKIVDLVIGLRVSEEVEREGLDLALHGEVVQ